MTGALYFLCVMQMFLNFLPTVIVFQGEKPVFIRERAGNMYDIWVYATTKMFAEIPIMLLVPLILILVVYPSIGFQNKLSRVFLILLDSSTYGSSRHSYGLLPVQCFQL